ncbi:hypothetical protein NW760_012408 [Fusarium oxysporum]|nr:hypothetical protein NW769_014359 [Fusarium oxysporum]KAJ4219785.1 hypothetical protein NW760_012408 [Fusarium oxysporum]
MENWLPPNFISVLFIPAPDLGLGDTYSKRSTNNTLDRVGRAKIGAMTTNIIPPIPNFNARTCTCTGGCLAAKEGGYQLSNDKKSANRRIGVPIPEGQANTYRKS